MYILPDYLSSFMTSLGYAEGEKKAYQIVWAFRYFCGKAQLKRAPAPASVAAGQKL